MITWPRHLVSVVGSPPVLPDGIRIQNLLTIPQEEEFAIVSLLTREGRITLSEILDMDMDTVLDFFHWTAKRLESENTRARQAAEEARQRYRGAGRRRR